MIIYHENFISRFLDFGIQIPLEVRFAKIHDYLKDNFGEDIFMNISKNVIPFGKEDLLLAHTPQYVKTLLGTETETEKAIMTCFELIDENGKYHRYNPKEAKYPLRELVDRTLLQAASSYQSMQLALKNGFNYFLGGGMHHAMSFGGRGFCLINDIVIGLRKLQKEGPVNSAWVIDIDAHKGDGTAELTTNDSTIFTLSIHMKNGWPLDTDCKSSPVFIPSTVDIPIAEGEEHLYLTNLQTGLEMLADKTETLPSLVIVIDGSDPYEDDQLPSSALLNLTLEQMLERDMLVYNFLSARNIPQSWLAAGGYGKNSWKVHAAFLNKLLSDRP